MNWNQSKSKRKSYYEEDAKETLLKNLFEHTLEKDYQCSDASICGDVCLVQGCSTT